MKRSVDRILSTHVGSLPRPPAILDALKERQQGKAIDQELFRNAIADAVRQQADVGLDIVTDGELSKSSFVTYVQERLSGFQMDTAGGFTVWTQSKEARAFPDFYNAQPHGTVSRMRCTAPIKYTGMAELTSDIETLQSALKNVEVEEAFIPSISPTNVTALQLNAFYPSEEEYNIAVADAMNIEYRAIVDSGFLLQIDDPHLVTHYVKDADITLSDARKWATKRVEYLNHALRGIPEDRVRFHTCAGINIGPRVNDMQLKDIVDILLRVKAGGYSFEYGNPRHEHEHQVWKTAKLPDDKVLIPGIISNSTVVVEHPELVADRIMRFAEIVGKERVIAGADCGFASIASNQEFPTSVIWAKFSSLTEGARLASSRLW